MSKFFSFIFAVAVLSFSVFGSSKQLLKIADQAQPSDSFSINEIGGTGGM